MSSPSTPASPALKPPPTGGRARPSKGPKRLLDLARTVIVVNLERFPPEALGILDEDEWNVLVRQRHARTAPKAGTGGIDGKGRLTPALKESTLREIETANPHLAESPIADDLLWKDCVNYSFRRESVLRPRVFDWPYPLLLDRIVRSGELFSPSNSDDTATTAEPPTVGAQKAAIEILAKTPMNLDLLMETGIGKVIRKGLKRIKDNATISPDDKEFLCTQMDGLLTNWKKMASDAGATVDVPGKKSAAKSPPSSQSSGEAPSEQDWKLVEECSSWRALYACLKDREEKRKARQGQRMREIRKNLNSDRPKVVKVRPSKPRSSAPPGSTAFLQANKSENRMSQLRREASVVSSRQNRGDWTPAARQAGFAAAVAGAAGSKKKGPKRNMSQLRAGPAGRFGQAAKVPRTMAVNTGNSLRKKLSK